MYTVKVEAGDFKVGKFSNFKSTRKSKHFEMAIDKFGWTMSGLKYVSYDVNQIEELSEAREDNVKRLAGSVGWGAAGAVLLGPIGLLAGLVAGGHGKNITFVCKFRDGKKFLGTTDSRTWITIQAALF